MSMLDLDSTAFASPPVGATPARVGEVSVDGAVDGAVNGAVNDATRAIPLADLDVGAFATIHAVLPTDNDVDRELVMRLIEIGFVPGERVRVIAVGHPGRQPVAVRLSATDSGRRNLNGATFAMRRHEANFIRVVPDTATEATR